MVLKSFSCAAASTNIFFFLLGFLQRKVDEIARLSETRRKEQERNFRLVSLERGSSHRGTSSTRLPPGSSPRGDAICGLSFFWVLSPTQPDKQGFERKGEGNSRAREKGGEVPSPVSRTLRFSRVRSPFYLSFGMPVT